jgi:hypothetical protein
MKLVGNFRAVVTHAEVGVSPKGKDVLKVTFDVKDEWINGQWMELPASRSVAHHYSLGSSVSERTGKTQAQQTAERVKESYGYAGPLSGIGSIVLTPVELVCEDHNDGNFTRIQYVNNPDKKRAELKPFDSAKIAELDRIFAAVA